MHATCHKKVKQNSNPGSDSGYIYYCSRKYENPSRCGVLSHCTKSWLGLRHRADYPVAPGRQDQSRRARLSRDGATTRGILNCVHDLEIVWPAVRPSLDFMDPVPIKILLLGDEKVGKSTFLAYVTRKPPVTRYGIGADYTSSRMSKGSGTLDGRVDITLLRDIDQPFIFEARNRAGAYRLEFYDTSSPENWRLLEPDVIIICYDISQRLSLINMQRLVCDFWLIITAQIIC
jgi:hypothetical protein